MAKKKAARGFVMASVREALEKDPTLTANQVVAIIHKQHPSAKFNEASAKVAFSNARRKMGIARKRRKVRRLRPMMAAAKASPRALKLDLLQAAKNLLAAAGSSENAISALRQVASLQVK